MEDAPTQPAAAAAVDSARASIESDKADSVIDAVVEAEATSPLFSSDRPSSVPTDGLESNTDEHAAVTAVETTPDNSGRSVRFSQNEEEIQHISRVQQPDLDVFEEDPQPDEPGVRDSRYSKERTTTTDNTIGATQVDERAPNINLRFFRGLGARNRRASQRSRNRDRRTRRREAQHQQQQGGSNADASGEMVASVRPMSNIMLEQQARSETTSRRFVNSLMSSLSQSRYFSSSGDDVLINATLVEEEELEYAVAEEMSWWQQHAKLVVPCLCLALCAIAGMATSLVLRDKRLEILHVPSEMPSEMPSSQPSMNPRPTLANVRERGYLNCGISSGDTPELIFREDMCRAVAAVVLGNADGYKGIEPFSFGDRWLGLQKGGIDIQITGDTQTVEREVELKVSFSTPYYYDGASYNGNATYVQCAYEQKRYDECKDLVICYIGNTAGRYVEHHFSPEFYVYATDWANVFEMFNNGTCNVIAGDRQATAAQMWSANLTDANVIGNTTFTNEPLAIVTRNDESEWTDIITWVMRALFFGEKQGIVQNKTLCDNDVSVTDAIQLNYLNAVYCVGNYKQIFTRSFGPSGRNQINHINYGTALLYETPFGDINDEDAPHEPEQVTGSILLDFLGRNLHCGVVVRKGCEDGNITDSKDICGMGFDMCTALASSLHNGNADAVDFTIFDNEETAFSELANRSIDVVVGIHANLEYDFRGVTFSMPYFYDYESGEDIGSVHPVATRDDEAIFATYVNCIVLAIVYAAAEGVTQQYSADMPAMTLFGKHYLWSLKDAVSAAGNYDEIYYRNFGAVADEDRGRNALNRLQTPQLFYNPGL